MKCDICGTYEATVHLTEVINDKITKLHICEVCAKTKSDEMQTHFGLTDLLSGLMSLEPEITGDEIESASKIKCSGCGMTYHDFQKIGRFGCGKCYDAFGKEISDLLRKIHGSDKHIGKMPFKGKEVVKEQEDLKRLKSQLNELIQKEEFEKAALLRDRIRELEEKLKK